MKKNFTILSAILITLISLTAKAQDDKPEAKSYIAFIGGLSSPLGSYGSNDYANNNAGFAHKGQTFGLDFGIYLHKNFGIGISLTVQDQGELDSAQIVGLANGYNSSFTKNQTSVTSVGRFSNMTLMVGPQYTFLYKKFALDLRASAGLIKSFTTPALTIVFDYSSNSGQTYYQESSGALAFAYGASAGLRYTLSDSWDVGLKVNYINSSGLKINNTGGDAGTTGRFQTNMPVSLIQPTLGITLKF
ncbi:MAG TPA: outer membrane beta-barrel protein [Mucilaginibacter sp.]|jgi:opacity protein-like surface antigen|nr:outer membrane beta-barrel protein [Mucilaginibacter sp.]